MTGTDTHTARTSVAVRVLGAVCAISLLLSGWALLSRFDAGNAYKKDNQRVWHAVICTIETAVQQDHKETSAQRQHVLLFYDHLLVADVHTSGCHLMGGQP